MAAVAPEVIPEDPPYITYLLAPELCDVFFEVGREKTERIGVVKKMLLAHCEALRSELFYQETEWKKDIAVCDIFPDTFKNLLRYVYGYDNTSNLNFDDADDLLYVAEKYEVKSLKSRLSTRLIKLLDYTNICSLMNNPVCYKVLELDAVITKILQYETDKVLASPQFLELTVDNLEKVMEQTKMNVSEIEVWRAALRWAQHRTNTDDGQALRKELERPAKHIRLCTIDKVTLFDEVFTTDILTREEFKLVCLAKSEGVRQEALVSFSNEMECRTRTALPCVMSFTHHTKVHYSSTCEWLIYTKRDSVELLPLTYDGIKPFLHVIPAFEFRSCITVTNHYSLYTSTEDPVTISSAQVVRYDEDYSVPFSVDGKNIVLQPHSRYHLKVKFSSSVKMYVCHKSHTYEDENISVEGLYYTHRNSYHSNGYYLLPSNQLHYVPWPPGVSTG